MATSNSTFPIHSNAKPSFLDVVESLKPEATDDEIQKKLDDADQTTLSNTNADKKTALIRAVEKGQLVAVKYFLARKIESSQLLLALEAAPKYIDNGEDQEEKKPDIAKRRQILTTLTSRFGTTKFDFTCIFYPAIKYRNYFAINYFAKSFPEICRSNLINCLNYAKENSDDTTITQVINLLWLYKPEIPNTLFYSDNFEFFNKRNLDLSKKSLIALFHEYLRSLSDYSILTIFFEFTYKLGEDSFQLEINRFLTFSYRDSFSNPESFNRYINLIKKQPEAMLLAIKSIIPCEIQLAIDGFPIEALKDPEIIKFLEKIHFYHIVDILRLLTDNQVLAAERASAFLLRDPGNNVSYFEMLHACMLAKLPDEKIEYFLKLTGKKITLADLKAAALLPDVSPFIYLVENYPLNSQEKMELMIYMVENNSPDSIFKYGLACNFHQENEINQGKNLNILRVAIRKKNLEKLNLLIAHGVSIKNALTDLPLAFEEEKQDTQSSYKIFTMVKTLVLQGARCMPDTIKFLKNKFIQTHDQSILHTYHYVLIAYYLKEGRLPSSEDLHTLQITARNFTIEECRNLHVLLLLNNETTSGTLSPEKIKQFEEVFGEDIFRKIKTYEDNIALLALLKASAPEIDTSNEVKAEKAPSPSAPPMVVVPAAAAAVSPSPVIATLPPTSTNETDDPGDEILYTPPTISVLPTSSPEGQQQTNFNDNEPGSTMTHTSVNTHGMFAPTIATLPHAELHNDLKALMGRFGSYESFMQAAAECKQMQTNQPGN